MKNVDDNIEKTVRECLENVAARPPHQRGPFIITDSMLRELGFEPTYEGANRMNDDKVDEILALAKSWDHCYPGNINIENTVDGLIDAIEYLKMNNKALLAMSTW